MLEDDSKNPDSSRIGSRFGCGNGEIQKTEGGNANNATAALDLNSLVGVNIHPGGGGRMRGGGIPTSLPSPELDTPGEIYSENYTDNEQFSIELYDTSFLSLDDQSLLNDYPQNLDNYLSITNYYMDTGDQDNGLKILYNGVILNNGNQDFHLAYGTYLSDCERYEDAVQEYKNAVDIDPTNPEALYSLGEGYQRLGLDDLAVKYKNEAKMIWGSEENPRD